MYPQSIEEYELESQLRVTGMDRKSPRLWNKDFLHRAQKVLSVRELRDRMGEFERQFF